ncbi:Trafficking protein particle complex subunit 33 [Tulasnella sp. 403]|nr:Trafficking protein particle complex subunit 33 [Tulasnella sp. 403]
MSGTGIYGPATSSVLATPAVIALAEDNTKLVDGAAFDYFSIELVRTLRESSKTATERIRVREEEMIAAGLLSPSAASVPASFEGKKDVIAPGQEARQVESDEEALRVRLENIGAIAGGNLAERLCKDKARFQDTLDTIKFICKDLWTVVWDKQVDNLRTNHRGVYVLQDNAFKPLIRISSPQGSVDALRRARMYTALSIGIIRGALSRFGYNAVVTAEALNLPQCTFQVKLPKGQ